MGGRAGPLLALDTDFGGAAHGASRWVQKKATCGGGKRALSGYEGIEMGRNALKRLGGGQPPSFPWHARPQSHEIQDFLSNLGFSKEFCDPCLSHDTIWHPRQRDEGICRQYKHVDK